MKHNNDKWIAAYQKAFADLSKAGIAKGASEGVVCAVATVRVIRDSLLAEFKPDDENADIIKTALNELLQDVQGAKLSGFASNASAAAKAAKLEDKQVSALNALTE